MVSVLFYFIVMRLAFFEPLALCYLDRIPELVTQDPSRHWEKWAVNVYSVATPPFLPVVRVLIGWVVDPFPCDPVASGLQFLNRDNTVIRVR